MRVADPVQGREDIARELRRLVQDGLDEVKGEVAAEPFGEGTIETRDVPHGVEHVGDGCAIGHGRSSVACSGDRGEIDHHHRACNPTAASARLI